MSYLCLDEGSLGIGLLNTLSRTVTLGPQESKASLSLASTTLVVASSIAIEATGSAVARSIELIQFAEVLWLSDLAPPSAIASRVEWRKIEPLKSREDYSTFMLSKLAGHVSTPHALCIQWDGYVLDPDCWDPKFLDYDYIGASWPQFSDGMMVGNGGFSLRSKRLLDACVELPDANGEEEDVFICRRQRKRLEDQHHIRFAPVELAHQFSFERNVRTGPTFGFHGSYNLVRMLTDNEGSQLLATLPPHALASQERREILSFAVRTYRWRLAWQVLRYWQRLFRGWNGNNMTVSEQTGRTQTTKRRKF